MSRQKMVAGGPGRLAMAATLWFVLAGCATQSGSSPAAAAEGTPSPRMTPSPERSTPTWSATPSVRPSPVNTAQGVIEQAIQNASGTGISACELVDGAEAWSGVAGSDAGAPVTASTRWSTGSIGKTVTSAQVLRLVDHGDLVLDEPAAKRLPEDFDTNGATVRDLLRMRSGLDTGDPPGKTFYYRNGDYELLGRVIEAVEGRPFGEVLTADILRVPGAERLVFPAGGDVGNAAGPLETDCPSLAHWGEALFAGRLLKPSSLALMTKFTDGQYGMGVFDFSADFREEAHGHLGLDGRWSAGLVYLPGRHTTLVVLMNVPDYERPYAVLLALARVLDR